MIVYMMANVSCFAIYFFKHRNEFKVWSHFVIPVLATIAMLALGPVGLRYRISLAGFLYVGAATALIRLVPSTSWRTAALRAQFD